MYHALEEKLNKVKYPNLLAEHYAGWCLDALAHGANVSKEIMLEVLLGKEDLTAYEKLSLAKYQYTKVGYLFSPKLSVLSKQKNRHKEWMNRLERDLSIIWEHKQAGSDAAQKFINSKTRENLVNLTLWFNMNDAYYNQFVTYAAYRRIKQETDWCLNDIERERIKPRTNKIRQSLTA